MFCSKQLSKTTGLGLVFGILNFIIHLDLCGEIVYWECLVAEILYFKTTNGLKNVWFQTNKYLQLHSKSSLCFRPIQARWVPTPNAEDRRPALQIQFAVQRPLTAVSCLLLLYVQNSGEQSSRGPIPSHINMDFFFIRSWLWKYL